MSCKKIYNTLYESTYFELKYPAVSIRAHLKGCEHCSMEREKLLKMIVDLKDIASIESEIELELPPLRFGPNPLSVKINPSWFIRISNRLSWYFIPEYTLKFGVAIILALIVGIGFIKIGNDVFAQSAGLSNNLVMFKNFVLIDENVNRGLSITPDTFSFIPSDTFIERPKVD